MRLRLNRLHRKLAAAFAVVGASAAAFACSAHGDSTSNASNVTSIPESPVTDQGATGSCWLYSTANWVESLHTSANGTTVHYSPAYWMYWAAYDALVQGQPSVDFGGYWGWAADIIQRYGMMPAGSFEIDDVNSQLIAVDAINAKIQAGLFGPVNNDADAGLQPRNATLVRAALDEAFKLGNDTRALLTKTFGIDGTHTFNQGATANGAILRAQDLTVMTPNQWGGLQQTTLDQLLGTASTDPNAGSDDRVGSTAWTAAYPPTTPGLDAMMGKGSRGGVPGRNTFIRSGGFKPVAAPTATGGDGGTDDDDDAGQPTDGGTPVVAAATNPLVGMPPLTAPDPVAWRAFYKRVQKALNAGVPLPMAFSVVDGNIDSQGRFHAGPSIVPTSDWGGHEVILTDYQITNVPNYGTLAAGVATTPAQKQASLDDNAVISFFRVKNSWGTDPNETGLFSNAAGYNDIDTAYLEQPYDLCDDSQGLDAGEAAGNCWAMAPQMWDVILPPGY